MRHMGNSGKLAVVAAGVSVGLLVLTSMTLEESSLFAFLAAVAVGYVACIAEVFARRRYLALVVGGIGSSLAVGFGIAFLRMWGLAFNQDASAMGTAVSTKDSDIYFYLAMAAGLGTLAVLFAGAVLPGRRAARDRASHGPASQGRPIAGRAPSGRTPAARTAAGRTPAPRSAATRKTTSTAGKSSASRTTAARTTAGRASAAAPRTSAPASTPAKRPVARVPAAGRKPPAVQPQRKGTGGR